MLQRNKAQMHSKNEKKETHLTKVINNIIKDLFKNKPVFIGEMNQNLMIRNPDLVELTIIIIIMNLSSDALSFFSSALLFFSLKF